MVKFSLFGVPVSIEFWFWITLVFLGGGLSAKTPDDMIGVALFVLAGTISILVHEFGHALVGRRLGGGYATIELIAFGGRAYNHGGRFTRWQRFWMIAAGPGAGFALLALVILGLMAAFNPHDGLAITTRNLFGFGDRVGADTIAFLRQKPFVTELIHHFLFINFWWGILNLLPILPLDGGQITNLFVRPQKLVHQIGIGCAALGAAYGILVLDSTYMLMFFIYFGWLNFQAMKESRWS